MSRKIIWSPRALADAERLISYVAAEWNQEVASKLLKRIEEVIAIIERQPMLYPATGHRPEVRRCVLSRQTSLYYRLKYDSIEIVALFDTRQDPDKKKL